jgi:hypothetical protein
MTPEDMMQQQVQIHRQMQEQMQRLQQMQANMQAQQEPPPWLPLAARMEWQAQQTSMTPSTPPEEMMQIEQEDKRLRFVKNDRVACRIEGRWAAGAVASLNEDDPSDETGQTKLPYVCRACMHASERASGRERVHMRACGSWRMCVRKAFTKKM